MVMRVVFHALIPLWWQIVCFKTSLNRVPNHFGLPPTKLDEFARMVNKHQRDEVPKPTKDNSTLVGLRKRCRHFGSRPKSSTSRVAVVWLNPHLSPTTTVYLQDIMSQHLQTLLRVVVTVDVSKWGGESRPFSPNLSFLHAHTRHRTSPHKYLQIFPGYATCKASIV